MNPLADTMAVAGAMVDSCCAAMSGVPALVSTVVDVGHAAPAVTNTDIVIQASYLVAGLLFLFGLRGLTKATTARRGTGYAALGMLIAVVATLLKQEILTYQWIIVGMVAGTIIGIPMGLKIPMTKMPERIALSHAFGGLAVALIGLEKYLHYGAEMSRFTMGAIGFEVFFGAITFTGSLMAFGKLQGLITEKPVTYRGQNVVNVSLLSLTALMVVYLIAFPGAAPVFWTMATICFLLGILLVQPIGGADMPVVICLMNSYAGLAASAAGMALQNDVLIICGALDGGSGFILALIMSKAMNRSFINVIFGAFGSQDLSSHAAGGAQGTVRSGSVEDIAELLRIANSVVIVPGYGMAAAQAQHAVKNLADVLMENGATVSYAIHPVAGRMPGHMNVLLAEANVPYDQLLELDQINSQFPETDVALVVGANDIVNPAARHDKSSPIFGMPIVNADNARAIVAMKRSMRPGFAGIDNELYTNPKTLMFFGDAKKQLLELVNALKSSH